MLLYEDGYCLFDRTWECLVSLRPHLGNVWTSDEFAVPVRDTVANLLDVGLDDLLKADEAEVTNAVMQLCSKINCQITPAGNA